jgi:hypothetical protein
MLARLSVAFTVVALGLVAPACSSGNGNQAGDNEGDGGGSGSGSDASGSTSSDASMATSGSSGGSGMDGASSSGSSSAIDASSETDAAEADGSSETDGSPWPDGSSSAGDAGDAAVVAMSSPPQVVNSTNATILTSPKVQLIGYGADTFLPDVEAELTQLATTSTWSQQMSEYGVGALTIRPPIVLTGTPPATIDDNSGSVTPFETTLANNTSGNSPAWGAADPSTIYLFVLPQGTQINSGGLCCSANAGFFGYHWEAPVGGNSVPYAVICNCPNLVQAPLTALDDVTTTITHELGETATDPFPNTNPAFGFEDQAHALWEVGTSGGEVADMCQYNSDANTTPPGSTYKIQRSWSNAAAQAGTNPCVPVPAGDGPYFNSYPTLPDTVTLGGTYWGGPLSMPGVRIPVGQTKTIDVVLKSEAPTSGPWKVAAYDLTQWIGNSSQAATQLTLDSYAGQSGDVLRLTIKVLATDPVIGGEGFVLVSDLDGQENMWFGAIGEN